MAEDGRIKTEFDDFIATLKSSGGKPLSLSKLAELCKVPDRSAKEWAHILERERKAELINRFDGVYILWDEKRTAAQAQPSHYQSMEAPASEILLAQEREQSAKNRSAAKISRQKISEARSELSEISDELSRVESAIEKLARLRGAEEDVAELNFQPEKQKQEHFELEQEIEVPQPKQDEALETGRGEEKGATLSEVQSQDEEAQPGDEYGLQMADEAPTEPQEVVRRPKTAQEILAARLEKAAGKKVKSRFAKMKRPEGLQVTEVSLKFSDRMARQIRKIEKAAREVEQIRAEKEKFLNDMYLPMQRKLESEIETISDRITKIESGVFDLQNRASDLPAKVAAVEKLQANSINAHGQMRKAYDEAAALIEQSNQELSDEISRMEEFAEQCRQEISAHYARTNELQKTLDRINQYEGDLSYQVSIAREAMSAQAERLSSAEKYASELAGLRGEIRENVVGIRREMGSTKAMLTELEKSMVQMRHISGWAGSIKEEYEARMQEIDDYIKNGNSEFETMRDAVEARFVRKYLKELRSLSESYTFELNQAKAAEQGIDARVEEARRKLAGLLEQGQKLAYKYESAAKIPEDSGAAEERKQSFESIEELGRQSTQVEQMIAQIVGTRKSEYIPSQPAQPRVGAKKGKSRTKRVKSSPAKRKAAKAKGKKKGKHLMRAKRN